MDSNTLQAYTKMTGFLGHALGSDYEINLFDFVGNKAVLVAIANIGITGRQLGDTLTEDEFRVAREGQVNGSNYIVHYKNTVHGEKILRSSTFFIKNANEVVTGLLTINFDDSKFTEVSDRIIRLIHPRAFIETSFTYNMDYNKDIKTDEDTALNSVAFSAKDIHNSIQQLKEKLGLHKEKLSAKENLLITQELVNLGVFDRKGTINEVAEVLGVSGPTMYRYVAQCKK